VNNNYIVGLTLIRVMLWVLGPGEGKGGWKEGEDVGETEGADICHWPDQPGPHILCESSQLPPYMTPSFGISVWNTIYFVVLLWTLFCVLLSEFT